MIASSLEFHNFFAPNYPFHFNFSNRPNIINYLTNYDIDRFSLDNIPWKFQGLVHSLYQLGFSFHLPQNVSWFDLIKTVQLDFVFFGIINIDCDED